MSSKTNKQRPDASPSTPAALLEKGRVESVMEFMPWIMVTRKRDGKNVKRYISQLKGKMLDEVLSDHKARLSAYGLSARTFLPGFVTRLRQLRQNGRVLQTKVESWLELPRRH
jgi:hypothetical protein